VARSRVELFEQIRKDRRVEGTSIRELADRHRVHRRTVRQALASAVPPVRKPYPQRPRPAIDDYAAIVDGWLVADRQVPRKQRHTARTLSPPFPRAGRRRAHQGTWRIGHRRCPGSGPAWLRSPR
jgi:hypothetical protein